MRKLSKILFLAAILLLMSGAESLRAQVTASATITLNVIPSPALSITQSKLNGTKGVMAVAGTSSKTPGLTFRSTGNLLIQLNSSDEAIARFSLQDGQARTLTSRDLKDVSVVRVTYIGT